MNLWYLCKPHPFEPLLCEKEPISTQGCVQASCHDHYPTTVASEWCSCTEDNIQLVEVSITYGVAVLFFPSLLIYSFTLFSGELAWVCSAWCNNAMLHKALSGEESARLCTKLHRFPTDKHRTAVWVFNNMHIKCMHVLMRTHIKGQMGGENRRGKGVRWRGEAAIVYETAE
jgi:hypothetical protein